MTTTPLLLAMVLLLTTDLAAAAGDVPIDQARRWYNEGEAQFSRGHFREACDQFNLVLGVVEVPAVAFRAASAHEKLGELVRAAELYSRAINMRQNEQWADADTQMKAKRDAVQALRALLPRVPTLRLEIEHAVVAEVTVIIDGNMLDSKALSTEQRLDPGEHTITATTTDGRTLTEKILFAEKDKRQVVIDLDRATKPQPMLPPQAPQPQPAPLPAPPPPPPTPPTGILAPPRGYVTPREPGEYDLQRTIAWASLGVGAAGLALGAVAGIVTWSKHSSLKSDGCTSEMACPKGVSDDRINSYNDWRKIPTPSFIVGGLATAAGLTLMFVPRRHAAETGLSLVVAPTAIELSRRF
jgi:hypothetical protein